MNIYFGYYLLTSSYEETKVEPTNDTSKADAFSSKLDQALNTHSSAALSAAGQRLAEQLDVNEALGDRREVTDRIGGWKNSASVMWHLEPSTPWDERTVRAMVFRGLGRGADNLMSPAYNGVMGKDGMSAGYFCGDELVTREGLAYFAKQSEIYVSQAEALYKETRAEGKSMYEFYLDLGALIARQPDRYIAMLGFTDQISYDHQELQSTHRPPKPATEH